MSTGQVAARSRDEIVHAIGAFSGADWKRLQKVARYYANGRPIEADDLLQKALLRAIDSRNCPAHVDAVKFVAEVIRSIADGEANKVEHKLVLVPRASDDFSAEAFNVRDPTPTAEQAMLSEERAATIRSAILALFDDEPVARDIVEGTMEDMTANELRELTGLSPTEYDSTRRFIRRRIDKAYPAGWKP